MNHKITKIANLLASIRECIQKGYYLDTRHAVIRRQERNITRPEILYVLQHGKHEKIKDQYEFRFKTWNYAIRGKTVDGKELRVIVSFESRNLLIITAIELVVN